jgi:hypothetical protein
VSHAIERAPGKTTLGVTHELTETVDVVRTDVLVRVLRVAEFSWVEDPKRGYLGESARSVDRAREGFTSRLVVVEGERDAFDAVLR